MASFACSENLFRLKLKSQISIFDDNLPRINFLFIDKGSRY